MIPRPHPYPHPRPHPRVTMAAANGDDAAEKVQIPLAAHVPEPLHGTPMDVQRA